MTLAIPDHIIWNDVPGALVLLDARDGTYHALSDSAAEIWRAIAAGRTRAEIASSLAERHAAAPATIATDVAAFLAQAEARGLLISGSPDPA